jgi:hypothetical protein
MWALQRKGALASLLTAGTVCWQARCGLASRAVPAEATAAKVRLGVSPALLSLPPPTHLGRACSASAGSSGASTTASCGSTWPHMPLMGNAPAGVCRPSLAADPPAVALATLSIVRQTATATASLCSSRRFWGCPRAEWSTASLCAFGSSGKRLAMAAATRGAGELGPAAGMAALGRAGGKPVGHGPPLRLRAATAPATVGLPAGMRGHAAGERGKVPGSSPAAPTAGAATAAVAAQACGGSCGSWGWSQAGWGCGAAGC